jgi:hypothetical protein
MSFEKMRFGVLVVFLSLTFGCTTLKGGTQPEETGEALTEEETSRKAWDEQLHEHPWTVSGEYFRQKEQGTGVDLREWLESRQEMEDKQKETEERLEALEKAVHERQPSEAPESSQAPVAAVAQPSPEPTVSGDRAFSSRDLRFKAAMVAFPEAYEAAPDVKEALLGSVGRQFVSNPQILLVGPEEVEEILMQQGLVAGSKNMAKVAQALGTYPAARLVVFVEKLGLETKGKKVKGSLEYAVVDGFSGRSITTAQEAGSASSGADGTRKVLGELVSAMAETLEKKAAQYDWYSRVAMVEGKQVYLTAGDASGLKVGDILSVYGPGREIVHPVAKVSMGFQRGPYKGKIKILKLFGYDAAEATLVSGKGKIEGNDLVALPE